MTNTNNQNNSEVTESKNTNFNVKFSTLEYFPVRKTLALYRCLSDILKKDPKKSRIKKSFNAINSVVNFPRELEHEIKNGILERNMNYGYTEKIEAGRLFSDSLSILNLPKEMRYYLFKDIYTDIDLVNSHPSILLDFAEKHEIKSPCLSRLVHSRDELYSQLINEANVAKSDIKKQVLITLNVDKLDNRINSKYINDLHLEILMIRERIWNIYMEENPNSSIGKYVRVKNKEVIKKVTAQTIYCFTKESELLLKLHDFLQKQANTHSKTLSFVPFFDGAYVRFDPAPYEIDVEGLVVEFNATIFPFVFTIKPIEPDWQDLQEELLQSYYNIDIFLEKLNKDEMEKLLEYFNMEPFQLSPSTVDFIKQLGSTKEGKKKLTSLYDTELVKRIDDDTSQYFVNIRAKLMPYAKNIDSLDKILEKITAVNK